MATETLKITLNDDGTIRTNARGMKGATPEILAELEALAAAAGGELVVEKHEPGLHHHHHGDESNHVHN
jgi:hypothetical protein